MKTFVLLVFSTLVSLAAAPMRALMLAVPPANAIVRDFIQISATDSMDFIRWKMEIGAGIFKLQCQYGLIKNRTPGFSNERRVAFEGQLIQSGNYYSLKHNGKSMSVFEVNSNVLYLLDPTNKMLIGNGGWSYTLNTIHPVEMDAFNMHAERAAITSLLVFEGRTPCQELAAFLGLTNSEACNKMKWYFLPYIDSVTGNAS